MVADVMKVKRMSYDEAFELSYFGAKVLHPNTMLPLMTKNIPMEIRNSTLRTGSGTRIERAVSEDSNAVHVKSIAFKSDVTVVSVSPHKRLDQYLFWEGIFSVLSRQGITLGNVCTSEYSIAFTVDGTEHSDLLKQQLSEYGRVTVNPGKGTIGIVGSNIRGAAGLLNRIFDALADVNVTMIASGASGLNISIVVENTQLQHALTRLHSEFFGHALHGELFEVPAK
jgi:aspartate kinase